MRAYVRTYVCTYAHAYIRVLLPQQQYVFYNSKIFYIHVAKIKTRCNKVKVIVYRTSEEQHKR